MYIRTKKGTILETEGNMEIFDVIEKSEDVIDLIAIGDLMFIDICPDESGGIVVPRIAETFEEGKIYYKKLKSGEYALKGIITKEQLEGMIYKL